MRMRSREWWREIVKKYMTGDFDDDRKYAREHDVGVHFFRFWCTRLGPEIQEELERERQEREPQAPEQEPQALDEVLVAAAEKHGRLTASQVSFALEIPEDRAREYLHWLSEEGRLARRASGRTEIFVPASS